MATSTTNLKSGVGFADLILLPFTALGHFLGAIMDSNSRVREAQALNAMSDAELAKRGLKREEIAHHVFRDAYYV
ncbi:hypothetical protein GTA62_12415 [Roseobacter sp. HKCCD9010]|uniref:DUF1127 domain-containing protein n=1 Tax=Rhodobacterales TaxID=204455 RepID=UPI0014917BD1|nr:MULTISPECIES: DUF1127 domain-containing protein [Rhodobacterales]MBF9050012.1 hypothetical protein [Rhodobacterales bacterium HKCCD4356]NNV12255.1 hypothetical protein [Roseobacter sp. HKCCD7357]NNV16282.1 hypothetical protein [Roseobacter sp. HKCCD8768]NNV25742.1 hypothetical protein [Roseobacter sp. HKCCD8192]NNV29998.1 hypothetical protein [Roseobacter sp. HKCCD9061]